MAEMVGRKERRLSVLDADTVIIFDDRFRCKILSNKDGVLTIQHIAAYTTPYPAICDMCNYFAELEREYGVHEIKIKLNQVPMSLTATNSKNPEELFRYWEGEWIKLEDEMM